MVRGKTTVSEENPHQSTPLWFDRKPARAGPEVTQSLLAIHFVLSSSSNIKWLVHPLQAVTELFYVRASRY